MIDGECGIENFPPLTSADEVKQDHALVVIHVRNAHRMQHMMRQYDLGIAKNDDRERVVFDV